LRQTTTTIQNGKRVTKKVTTIRDANGNVTTHTEEVGGDNDRLQNSSSQNFSLRW
jgi:hypothetical protein